MAPRTVDVTNSTNTNTQAISQTATKQDPDTFESSSSFKQKMLKPNLPFFNPYIYDGLTAESVEFKLHNLAARCEQAERRALRIRLKINRLRVLHRVPVRMIENLSDATESSSEDELIDVSEHDELSIRNRAALRCHWFSFKSEKVIAEDCLRNLRKLRREFSKSRVTIKCEDDDCAIRTRPYEASSVPRRKFFKLSTSDLNFQYPGNARPTRLHHPCCNQACSFCICCCSAFDRKAVESTNSAYPDVAERSIAVDKPKCQGPVNDYIPPPRVQLLSNGRSFKSQQRESHPSGSSGVSSLGSQDDCDRILHISASLSRPVRTSSSADLKRKYDFPSTAPNRNSVCRRSLNDGDGNNIPHISWKKVPYPSSVDTERDLGLRLSQNMYKYREHSLTNHHQHTFENPNGMLELAGSRKRKFSSTLPPKFLPNSKRSHLP
ncbi:unnamed protein product [Rodentolepis nana]|uniref:PEHE domain-containing protein n=1 Tax=Rodentolepis nana TaxID=102285 RepID=A0A0R3TP88_RODNA|nr:unnamed protein product [Rodentolepis nana]